MRVALAAAALLGCWVAAAPGFEIVDTAPKRYALGVQPGLASIEVTFDAAPALPAAGAVRVCGTMSGLHPGAASVVGNTLRIAGFAKPFQVGELVHVNLRADVQAAAGGGLAGGRYFAFTIGAVARTPDWTSFTTYGTADVPYFIFGGDLNADGRPDLAVPNEGTDNVSVFLNSAGDGSFPSHTETTVGQVPSSIFGDDLDNDGDLDVATADIFSGTVTVLRNNGLGAMSLVQSLFAGNQTRQIHGGDFDGDNDVDLCATSRMTDEVYLFYNDGTAHFTGVTYTNVANGPFAIRTADLDLDGHLDIGVACQDADSLVVLRNTGTGSFTTSGRFAVGNGPWCLNGNDFDADGDFDLVSVTSFANRIVLLVNDGTGGFAVRRQWTTANFPLGVYAADVDGDGDVDATSSNYGGASVGVYLNNGAGQFGTPTVLATQASGSYAWAHDLDGDSDLDLSVVDENADLLFVFLNGGTASDAPGLGHAGRARLRLWPNPVRAGAALQLDALDTGGRPATLALWSADGRLVRRDVLRVAGEAVAWEARDARGRPLAAGRYWLEWTSADARRAVRALVVTAGTAPSGAR